MTRYEFDILTYLEKHGKAEYAVRTIADSLKLSGTAVGKALEELCDQALISSPSLVKGNPFNGGVIEVTEKGLQALEPYRVKKAVIMAAGFGSRMMPATADRPKPLVSVNGKRIIETLLDALVAVGIQDITIVRGYKKERFDDLLPKYPFLTLVDNDIYDKTNNISSAMAVIDKIDTCYLCEADLYISNPEIITKYQYASNILGSWSWETDDWSYHLDAQGHITDYQKGNTHCWNYYGISFWTKEDSAKLREDFRQVYEEEKDGKDYFWEFIPLVLRKEKYAVEVRECQKSDIMEIDNYYELAQLDPSYRKQE
ncbi:MAG: phosphocholine cytidylyltransferase family protein [Treponema sp.]|nr:phosphocholine cytidylyltransferase family protein [Treponema sp.]